MSDLTERLKEAANEMRKGVHSPGHIAAVEEAIKALDKKDAERNGGKSAE